MFPHFRPHCFWFCVLAVVHCGLTTKAWCQHASEPEGIEFFEQHIRPLLASRCYSCHSIREQVQEGDLVLDRQQGWEVGGSRGPAVVPGDVDASPLIVAVRHQDDELRMPPKQRLTDKEIARLEHWVKMGAPAPNVVHTEATRLLPSDPVKGKEHWAFRPLSRTKSGQSSIDQFVLLRLQEHGLQPSGEADRRTLARRLYFHLVGLPPSPDELEFFVADERHDAYEQLVDKLLGSSQFGERWGRHWLDLARYADSNGLDENFLFREAWRYRNWVIEAINDDMPYDRFLREQIAGDLLPHSSIEQRDRQRIGAGFLVIGPKVLLGNIPENQRMEIADEQLDTIGKAVLGQTLGCARCHDHKFDPIPTEDYYALAGILTSTKVVQRRHMLGQQRVMERLVGLGADGDALNEAYERYWRERPSVTKQLQQAKQAFELVKSGDEDGLAEFAKKHAEAIADGVLDGQKSKAARAANQQALVSKLEKIVKSPVPIPPRAMIPGEIAEPADEKIRLAGQFDRIGKQVPRGFLQVLSDRPPSISDEQSGRLELAHWLTDADHGAGRLAARVLANRIWHHLFGVGIVRTVDNFGRTGAEPTHPELLDFLAHELIASNWSMKRMIRQMVLSRTYRMSSDHHVASHAVDPSNRWLWRAHRRRLEPEALRDGMLAIAGQLDKAATDSTVAYLGDQATAVGANKNRRRTDFPYRSVYLPVIRNDLPELFDAFDFADPHSTTGQRPDTMVPTQGLFMLNSTLVMDAAEATARRLLASRGRPEALADRLYQWACGVAATDEERQGLVRLVALAERSMPDAEDASLRAWTLACHAVFASSRFQILE